MVEKSALDRLVDVNKPRGAGGRVSDHFLVVAKVKCKVGFRIWKEQVQSKKVVKVSEKEYTEKVKMA